MTSYKTSTSNNLLSDYEQLRARNIERNNKRLRELGLISALEEQTSNDIAWGRRQTTTTATSAATSSSDNSAVNSDKYKKTKTAKKRHSSSLSSPQSSSFVDSSDVPRRKSPRLQGLGPELSPATEGNIDKGDSISISSSLIRSSRTIADIRKARVDECRLVREKLARMIQLNTNNGGGEGEGRTNMERIIAEAGKENPTATYAHCLMRVRTMSHKQLIQRIKTIERAKGKHCVIKMVRTLLCIVIAL